MLNVSSKIEIHFRRFTDWTSFVPSRIFLDREELRSGLSASYAVPRVFWTPACQESNGFFGSEDITGANGSIEGHGKVSNTVMDREQHVVCILICLVTWFRYIIKKVDPKQTTYSWSEMSFFTRWTRASSVTLCFDVPKTSQMRTHQALVSRQQRLDFRDIYAGHVIVLDEVLALFDESVWALRDEVRRIEKVPLNLNPPQCILPD